MPPRRGGRTGWNSARLACKECERCPSLDSCSRLGPRERNQFLQVNSRMVMQSKSCSGYFDLLGLFGLRQRQLQNAILQFSVRLFAQNRSRQFDHPANLLGFVVAVDGVLAFCLLFLRRIVLALND